MLPPVTAGADQEITALVPLGVVTTLVGGPGTEPGLEVTIEE